MPSSWPNGWNVYYIVVIAGALSWVVPALLSVLSYLVSDRGKSADASSSAVSEPDSTASAQVDAYDENPTAAGKRTNPRAFIALNSAFLLLAMAFLMLPCVMILNQTPALGLICMLSLCLLAGLALLYGIRKRDMDWLMTFMKTPPEAEKEKS